MYVYFEFIQFEKKSQYIEHQPDRNQRFNGPAFSHGKADSERKQINHQFKTISFSCKPILIRGLQGRFYYSRDLHYF